MAHSRTWDSSYEADPADSDQASGGALDIRNTRIDTRERLVYDHSWAGDDDDGFHKKVTFVDPLGAKPTQADDQSYLYTKDVSGTSELFYEDEAGNEVQLTQAGAVQAFPSGTKMIFYQATAPTGWTIDAAVDERMVYIDKDNGGTLAGTSSAISMEVVGTVDSDGAHTHTIPEMDTGNPNGSGDTSADSGSLASLKSHDHTIPGSTYNTGSDGAHTHAFTSDAYVPLHAKCIVATKD